MVAEVEVPAGFVPQYAVAFGAVDGPAVAVQADNPLPVRAVPRPAQSAPCLLYTSPSPRDKRQSRMPSSA